MTSKNPEVKVRCSICEKQASKELKLAKVRVNLYVCEECVVVLDTKFKSYKFKDSYTNTDQLIIPSEIVNLLDQYVAGQESLKNKLSVAIYNHQKMIRYKENHKDDPDAIEIEKSNIIMVGPTGTGKTHVLKTLAKQLDIPLIIEDSTSLTQAGYVGSDVENSLRKLLEKCDYDIEKAQKGIIFFDEIDKTGRKGENVSITRDVSGEGVQQALLKIIEGTIAEVPSQGGRKHPNQETIKIDTSNILFICGGSFEGIDKIIAKRKQGKSTMGIGSKIIDKTSLSFNDYIDDITTEDLKQFGMLPEFLGRFPIIATLNELNEEALLSILTKPKNALTKQYVALLKEDQVDLIFTEGSLKAIAQKAIKSKIGARGLRSIINEVLLDTMRLTPNDSNITTLIIEEDLSITKKYKNKETA